VGTAKVSAATLRGAECDASHTLRHIPHLDKVPNAPTSSTAPETLDKDSPVGILPEIWNWCSLGENIRLVGLPRLWLLASQW
jgi:hypothetical protein